MTKMDPYLAMEFLDGMMCALNSVQAFMPAEEYEAACRRAWDGFETHTGWTEEQILNLANKAE